MGKRQSIRVELEGEILKTFLELKEIHNFKTNTECIRWCISEASNESAIDLTKEQMNLIQTLIKKPQIRKKFLVFNRREFIKKSLDHYIEFIEKNMPSIQDWDVRNSLPEKKLDIALAVIKCQANNPIDMVTLDEVISELNTKNTYHVRKILEKFIDEGILDVIEHKGKTYYHARK